MHASKSPFKHPIPIYHLRFQVILKAQHWEYPNIYVYIPFQSCLWSTQRSQFLVSMRITVQGYFQNACLLVGAGEMNCLEYSLVPVLGSSILLLPQKIREPDPPSPQHPGSLLSQWDTSTQGFEPKTNREIQEEKVRIQMQWSQWWYLAETAVSWPDYYKQNIIAPPPNTLD